MTSHLSQGTVLCVSEAAQGGLSQGTVPCERQELCGFAGNIKVSSHREPSPVRDTSYVEPSMELIRTPGGVSHRAEVADIDVLMSEAPSMTICGGIGIDRTFVPIPDTEGLFLVYNSHQEKWHLEMSEKHGAFQGGREGQPEEPVIVIPEAQVAVYSRCLIVRKGADGKLVSLQEGDLDAARRYMANMAQGESRKW